MWKLSALSKPPLLAILLVVCVFCGLSKFRGKLELRTDYLCVLMSCMVCWVTYSIVLCVGVLHAVMLMNLSSPGSLERFVG